MHIWWFWQEKVRNRTEFSSTEPFPKTIWRWLVAVLQIQCHYCFDVPARLLNSDAIRELFVIIQSLCVHSPGNGKSKSRPIRSQSAREACFRRVAYNTCVFPKQILPHLDLPQPESHNFRLANNIYCMGNEWRTHNHTCFCYLPL